MSWAHKSDPEWMAFTAENARGGATLVFGRVTYEMMASFWPTPAARQAAPDVAAALNKQRKVVFSRTLKQAAWPNTTLVNDDPAVAIRVMKQREAQDLVILGSGRIVAQLAQADLIDEIEIVVNPLVLGRGRTMFEGVERRLEFELSKTRQFANGNMVLWYERG
jgi:dihydrofolate reductase